MILTIIKCGIKCRSWKRCESIGRAPPIGSVEVHELGVRQGALGALQRSGGTAARPVAPAATAQRVHYVTGFFDPTDL